jgi:putative nucleotidyltransferase with HDIG domain
MVKPYQMIEEQLKRRIPGWWESMMRFIPELEELAQTPQPPQYHVEGDVAAHTRMAVEACPPDGVPDLLWAALLHDVGKAAVTKLDGDRITAHGHDIVSAEMAEKVLQRLQMPVAMQARIIWAIRHHTFHLSWNLNDPGQASRRQKKMVADDRFPLLLELLRVDSEASPGNPRGMKAYALYKRLREKVLTSSPV